ncbi:MAG TPA: hypothetical protein VGC85_11505 [Chthoniobacterales bacterium]
MFELQGVDHAQLAVPDVPGSIQWYTNRRENAASARLTSDRSGR